MKDQIIISLGSNLGDRMEFLHKALALLEAYPISVKQLSQVYETPAWGFESTPFYNACASLDTTLDPQALLEVFLEIEQQLGRYREPDSGYAARTIDLDLLFYKNEIICTSDLKVPHPKLHQRNFVLKPLSEIAPSFTHPILFQSVEQLVAQSPDPAEVIPLKYNLGLPPILKVFPYIAIEGNIGVGKTTLASLIANYYQVVLHTEAFAENPHLEDFYQNPEAHALQVETYFLNDRFEKDTLFWEKEPEAVIADFCLHKCLVFAAENLSSDEFETYREKFDLEIEQKKKPSLLLFLKASVVHLKKQIQARGRSFEQGIEESYLEQIEAGYRRLLNSNLPFAVLEIDVDRMDFEKDEYAFQKILRAVFRASFS